MMTDHMTNRPSGDDVTHPTQVHPDGSDLLLDQLLAEAGEGTLKVLDAALNTDAGLMHLRETLWDGVGIEQSGPVEGARAPSGTAPGRPDEIDQAVHATVPSCEEHNSQVLYATALLQQTGDQLRDMLNVVVIYSRQHPGDQLEETRSKLAITRVRIDELIAETQARRLTKAVVHSSFEEIHAHLGNAWTLVAQELAFAATEPSTVLLKDFMDTIDTVTQRIEQCRRVLDHLLGDVDEDLEQPLLT